jgi:hypothetical protein
VAKKSNRKAFVDLVAQHTTTIAQFNKISKVVFTEGFQTKLVKGDSPQEAVHKYLSGLELSPQALVKIAEIIKIDPRTLKSAYIEALDAEFDLAMPAPAVTKTTARSTSPAVAAPRKNRSIVF